jgi:hypothetical protein
MAITGDSAKVIGIARKRGMITAGNTMTMIAMIIRNIKVANTPPEIF